MRRLLAAALLSAIVAACGSLFPTPIGKIVSSPRDYDGKRVTVSGVVKESAGLLFLKYFVLADKSGEICVVTSKMLPRTGDSLTATGTVQEAFAIGDQSLVVIVEAEQ